MVRGWLGVALVVLSACKGSSSQRIAGKRDAEVIAPPPVSFSLVTAARTAEHSYVVVSAAEAVTVIAEDGTIAARATMPLAAQQDLELVGHWLAWTTGTTLHVLDLHGGAQTTGTLRAPPTGLLAGETTIAFMTADGVDLYDLATATSVFHADGAIGPSVYRVPLHRYVLVGADHVRAIDEATHTVRWVTPVAIESQIQSELWIEQEVTMRSRTAYARLALDTGHVIASGPVPALASSELGRRSSDHDYRAYDLASVDGGMYLQAHDAANVATWSTELLLGTRPPFDLVESPESHLVVVSNRQQSQTFDASTGAARGLYAATGPTKLVGISAGTAVYLDDQALYGADPTGARRWAVNLAGGDHHAWRVGGESGDLLLADGNPLGLKRIDRTGAVQWRVLFPHGVLDPDGQIHDADGVWRRQLDLLVLVAPAEVRLLDLATGVLHVAKP